MLKPVKVLDDGSTKLREFYRVCDVGVLHVENAKDAAFPSFLLLLLLAAAACDGSVLALSSQHSGSSICARSQCLSADAAGLHDPRPRRRCLTV